MRRLALLSILIIGAILFGACAPSAPPAERTTPAPTPTPKSHIYTRGIIEVGGDGEPIELINNPDATNPTYAELLAFIKKDRTDKYSYIFGPPKVAYVCSDFAEDVHNNAESAGIRAAWVGIDIYGDDGGHACNAFETTDMGLVYIDCTGEGLWSESPSDLNSWDRRARVEIGKEYAVKDIDKAKAQFKFLVSIQGYIDEVIKLKEWKLRSPEILEWVRTHDIQVLGQRWMQEWMREHEAELHGCGREMEPVGYYGSQNFWGWESHFVASGWRVYVDCVEVPWFQRQVEVIDVDGMPVTCEVSWDINWFEPLGIVRDIHIHW